MDRLYFPVIILHLSIVAKKNILLQQSHNYGVWNYWQQKLLYCICFTIWIDWHMMFGLEQEGGSLIAPMALAHPLHPIDNRSRNRRWNLWVGWCVFLLMTFVPVQKLCIIICIFYMSYVIGRLYIYIYINIYIYIYIYIYVYIYMCVHVCLYVYIYIYIYIIHNIPIGHSQTRLCPTWSYNKSYISFAKSCIGLLVGKCLIYDILDSFKTRLRPLCARGTDVPKQCQCT